MTVCYHSRLSTHYRNKVQNLAAHRCVTRLIIAALTLIGASAGAQGPPRFASPALPPDHWAVSATRRAVVLGLTPREIGWAEGSLTQAVAGWALREASERSKSLAPAIHVLGVALSPKSRSNLVRRQAAVLDSVTNLRCEVRIRPEQRFGILRARPLLRGNRPRSTTDDDREGCPSNQQ